jgi:hypothetical protein
LSNWTAQLERALTVEATGVSWFGEPQKLEGNVEQALKHHLYLTFYTPGAAVSVSRAEELARGVNSEIVEHYSKAFGSSWLFDPTSTAARHQLGITWDEKVDDPGFGASRISPGYAAYSAAGLISNGHVPRLRLYLNLWPPGVVALLEYLGARDRDTIVHSVKALRPPYAAVRTDVVVVYLQAASSDSYKRLFGDITAATQGLRQEPTPIFTRQFADGIGLAIGPPDGDSFGAHRCGLVAKAVLANTRCRSEPLVADLNRVFTEAGTSIDAPHSDFALHVPNLAAPRRRVLRKPALRPVRELVAALEYGSIDKNGERLWLAVDGNLTAAVDSSSYSGHAGIALALSAAADTGDDKAHRLAVQAARTALRHTTLDDRNGLHFGATGVLGAIAVAPMLLGVPAIAHGWQALADRFARRFDGETSRLDLLDGLAGTVMALAPTIRLHSGLSLIFDTVTARLKREADRIVETADPSMGPGVAHGLSGLIAALWTSERHSQGSKFALPSIWRLTDLEDRYFDQGAGNWLRKDDSLPNRYWLAYQRSWCHGGPGIVTVRDLVGGALPEGFRRPLPDTVPASAVGRNDWSLCHGRSGMWALGRMSSSAQRSTPYSEIEVAAELSLPRSGWWTPPGLMDGRAGVLLAALAALGSESAWRALAWALGTPATGASGAGYRRADG